MCQTSKYALPAQCNNVQQLFRVGIFCYISRVRVNRLKPQFWIDRNDRAKLNQAEKQKWYRYKLKATGSYEQHKKPAATIKCHANKKIHKSALSEPSMKVLFRSRKKSTRKHVAKCRKFKKEKGKCFEKQNTCLTVPVLMPKLHYEITTYNEQCPSKPKART